MTCVVVGEVPAAVRPGAHPQGAHTSPTLIGVPAVTRTVSMVPPTRRGWRTVHWSVAGPAGTPPLPGGAW